MTVPESIQKREDLVVLRNLMEQTGSEVDYKRRMESGQSHMGRGHLCAGEESPVPFTGQSQTPCHTGYKYLSQKDLRKGTFPRVTKGRAV